MLLEQALALECLTHHDGFEVGAVARDFGATPRKSCFDEVLDIFRLHAAPLYRKAIW